jgi:ribulose-5-phosphate 4-epimerase/fuculose-1-phosphate aldolase
MENKTVNSAQLVPVTSVIGDVEFVHAISTSQNLLSYIEAALKKYSNLVGETSEELDHSSLVVRLEDGRYIDSELDIKYIIETLNGKPLKLHIVQKPKPSKTLTRKIQLSSNLSKYSPEEVEVRIQLAAAYRLFAKFGWTDTVYNHLTAAVPGHHGRFLINPFGLLFEEITASSLITIDFDGNILDQGTTDYDINKPGLVLHSAVHAARPDIKVVMHNHQVSGVAVSAYKNGLLPITQNALLIIDQVRYHNFEGIVINEAEKKRIVEDLGPTKKILICKNHGPVTCGSNVAEAFTYMYQLIKACEMQIAALSQGPQDVVTLSKELVEETTRTHISLQTKGIGTREFTALVRQLDSEDQSYKL